MKGREIVTVTGCFLSAMLLQASLTSGIAGAEEDNEKTTTQHLSLEEIVISDSVLTDQQTTEVNSKSIEKGKNTTIPDVLKYESDITINRKALVGDTGDTLQIRGMSGNRIMLNVDGRPVNAAGVQGGYFIDWSTIPLDNIEKIEVMKGGSSVIYGNNAGGGVINVVTRKPTEEPSVTLSSNVGVADEITMQNYRFTHTNKIGPLGYSIGSSFQKADDFLWNNDYEAKNLNTKFYLDMPWKGDLTLGMQYTNVDRGFTILNRLSTKPDDPGFNIARNPDYPVSLGDGFSPGAGNVTTPGPGANWEKEKYLLDASYKQPIGDADIIVKAYKNYEDRDEKNYSASWLNTAFADGKLVLDRTVKSDRSYGGSVESIVPLGTSHELHGGVERKVLSTGGQDVHYVDKSYGLKGNMTDSTGTSAYMWGYYLQDSWSITDSFLLTPGIRFDTYKAAQSGLDEDVSLKQDGVSPSLTATYSPTRKDTITSSVYSKVLTPSSPDAWWWYEGYMGDLYDTTLKMERNNAVELSYQHDFLKQAFAKLSAYHYDIQDYIKRYSVPDGSGRGCYNIDNVKIDGISLDAAAPAGDLITLRGNVSYQKSKKEGDIFDTTGLSDRLEYMPEWKINGGFDCKLPFQAVFSLMTRYVGEQETINSNKVRTLDSYVTVDAEIKIPVAKTGQIGLFVEDLFDEEHEERFGYPLPGRVVGMQVTWGF